MLGDMTNRTAAAPADLTAPAASLAEDNDLAHALCCVDDLLGAGPAAEGPAEVVGNLLASLAYLLRATACSRSRASLTECAAVYERAAKCLSDWRVAAGCQDWAAVDFRQAEVVACIECDDRLHTLKAKLLEASAGVDGGVYRRVLRAA